MVSLTEKREIGVRVAIIRTRCANAPARLGPIQSRPMYFGWGAKFKFIPPAARADACDGYASRIENASRSCNFGVFLPQFA
jgi:hypothetical protein